MDGWANGPYLPRRAVEGRWVDQSLQDEAKGWIRRNYETCQVDWKPRRRGMRARSDSGTHDGTPVCGEQTRQNRRARLRRNNRIRTGEDAGMALGHVHDPLLQSDGERGDHRTRIRNPHDHDQVRQMRLVPAEKQSARRCELEHLRPHDRVPRERIHLTLPTNREL